MNRPRKSPSNFSSSCFLLLSSSLLLLSLLLLQSPSSIHSFKTEFLIDHPVCFYEYLNPRSQMVVRYNFPEMGHSRNAPHSLYVQVDDESGRTVVSQVKTENKGQVYCTAPENNPGNYRVCLTPKAVQGYSASESPIYRVEVDVGVDDAAIQYDKLESKEHLEQVSALLDRLKDKVQFIEEDQKYYRKREERFIVTSESVASRTFWYGVIMVALLASLGTWQVYTMKHFFHVNKMD